MGGYLCKDVFLPSVNTEYFLEDELIRFISNTGFSQNDKCSLFVDLMYRCKATRGGRRFNPRGCLSFTSRSSSVLTDCWKFRYFTT